MKGGVEAWIDGRVGRVSDRKDWGKITFDHNNPDFRAKIRDYFLAKIYKLNSCELTGK
jgi:hypothetical protein